MNYKVYINDRQFATLRDLQMFIDTMKDGSLFTFTIEDEEDTVYENELTKSDDLNDFFLFLYENHIMKAESCDNSSFRKRHIIQEIFILEKIYVLSLIEDDKETAVLLDESDDLCCFYTEQDYLLMAEKCALYDIENHLSRRSLAELSLEYYNLSKESLIEEYTRCYSDDLYEERCVMAIKKYKQHKPVVRCIERSKEEYQHLKKIYRNELKNVFRMEMER